MSTLDIVANNEITDRLVRLHHAERLAHAYLFIGSKFTGKSETAIAIANELSTKIDTHLVECEFGERIKIDEIREILGMCRLRPFSGDKKVFIIRDVEHLTLESSNALLKTLEEPTSSSLIILTTSVIEKILPTIISRCHRVHFATPSKEYLAEQLKTHYHEDTLRAHFLSAFSDGSLGVAQKYREKGLFELKNDWITQFVFGSQGDAFIKNNLKDKEVTKDFLDVLLSWMHDVVLVKTNANANMLINLDRKEDLVAFANKYSFEYLQDIYHEVVQAHKMLTENLNIKLPLLIIKEKLLWAR